MPRPKPVFSNHESYFYGLDYNKPNNESYNNNTKVEIICKNGHIYKLSVNEIKNQNKDPKVCPHCKKQKEYKKMGIPFNEVEKWAEKYDLHIVNKKDYYNKWKDVLHLKCNKCGNETVIRSLGYWSKTKGVYECKECKIIKLNILDDSDLLEKNTEIIKESSSEIILEERIDYNILPNRLKEHLVNQSKWNLIEYTNTRTKCKYQCSECGYIKECTPYSIFIGRGGGCLGCKKGNDLNRVSNKLSKLLTNSNMYIPLDNFIFNNSYVDIPIKCNKCGYEFNNKWIHMNQLDRMNCPKCYRSTKRLSQNELRKWIESITQYEVIDEYKVNNKIEIDIFIPELKIGIEYCGLIWHSTKYKTDSSYHYNKWNYCKENGIRLITIFEDEWKENREICVSRIRNLLQLSTQRAFARKTECKFIDNKTALQFCKENHIQGKGQSHEAYGLFYENDLVSVMTFSKPSVSKNGKNYDWELNRFCSKIGYSIVGGASKLLKAFENNHQSDTLVSFCDLRWGDGTVYYNLGFSFDKITKPNYYYFGKITNWQRKHRYNYRKSVLVEMHPNYESLSEKEISEKIELYRIYDCGHIRFTKQIGEKDAK